MSSNVAGSFQHSKGNAGLPNFAAGYFIVGHCFVVLQYQGWQQLYSIGVALDGIPVAHFMCYFEFMQLT
jgi:hypothetical protein